MWTSGVLSCDVLLNFISSWSTRIAHKTQTESQKSHRNDTETHRITQKPHIADHTRLDTPSTPEVPVVEVRGWGVGGLRLG